MAPAFDKLPDELVTKIFSFLSLTDRKKTRLVCQRFRNINSELSLVQTDVLAVDDYSILNDSISSHRIYTKVRVSVIGSRHEKKHMRFWKKYGDWIKTVTFIYCHNNELKTLIDVIAVCPHLENLELVFWGPEHRDFCICLDVFDLDLSNVKLLDLNQGLCAIQFERLLKTATKVEVLRINRGYVKDIMDSLLAFLQKRGPKLKEILLNAEFNDEEQLKILSLCPNLTKIYVAPIVSDAVLDVIGTKLTSLKDLSLAIFDNQPHNKPLKESDLTNLLQNLNNLTHVYLFTKLVTDKNVSIFGAMPNLCSLSLIDSPISKQGFDDLFGLKTYPKIKYVFIEDASNLTDSCLLVMLPNLPNLETLIVFGCHLLKGTFVHKISNPKLQKLKIAGCFRVDLGKCFPAFNKLPGLTFLEAHSADGGCMDFNWGNLKLPELKALVTNFEETVYNVAELKTAFNNCPKLEYIVDCSTIRMHHEYHFAFLCAEAVDKDLKRKPVKLWLEPDYCVTK